MMTIQDLASELNIDAKELERAMEEELTDNYIDTNTTEEGYISRELESTLKKIASKRGLRQGDDTSSAESDTEVSTEQHGQNIDVLTEKKKPVRRKAAPKSVEIESDIDKASPSLLRLFMAENMNIKPEKVFFMDDAMVKEKVDEKYVFVERNDDFVVIKKGITVLSVKKTV